MDSNPWVLIVQCIVGGLVAAYLAYLQARTKAAVEKGTDQAKTAAETAAAKAEEMKVAAKTTAREVRQAATTAAQKVDEVIAVNSAQDEKLDKIQKQLNGGALRQAQLLAELWRWKAERTRTAEDEAAAVLAETKYQEQLTKQSLTND